MKMYHISPNLGKTCIELYNMPWIMRTHLAAYMMDSDLR